MSSIAKPKSKKQWVGRKLTPKTFPKSLSTGDLVVRWTPGSGKIPARLTELSLSKTGVKFVGLGDYGNTQMLFEWDPKFRRWRWTKWAPGPDDQEDEEIYYIAPIKKSFVNTKQFAHWNAGWGEPGSEYNPW